MGRVPLHLLWAVLWILQPPAVCAEPPDSRCDFTDCGGVSDPFADPFAVKRKSSDRDASVAQRACRIDDREGCKEECRTVFGPEYHLCVSECLAKICSDQTTADGGGTVDEKKCVEDSSEACVSQCKDVSGSAAGRCRRACLAELCPNASATDVVAEANDPGKLACNRCRVDVERECARTCVAGTMPLGKSMGLANLGCEKACIMSRCGANCVSLMPF